MKKSISLIIPFLFLSKLTYAEDITLEGKSYDMERLIERKIGPGTTYLRLRLPDYPLNVNMIMVDLTNPYNRIETTVAKESAKGTELLTTAAKRLDSSNHHPLAAANANFWIVASQKEYPLYAGITRNASVRNGKMVTESNQFNEKWDKGTTRTGVVSLSYDKTLNIDYCTSSITFKPEGGNAAYTIHQCNKGMRVNEYCMYNSFYGRDREFMPYKQVTLEDSSKLFQLEADSEDATELLLDLKPGEEWTGGNDIKFIVKEVRKKAGHGKLGNYDLAIVGRGTTPQQRLDLPVGSEVTLNYNWTYSGNIVPLVEQAIGGNALVMRHGVLTEHNTNETYNSQIYSRTAYGCSEDGKTLYIIVIDKSTDPIYGKSAGCNTSKMCEIARHFGCWNMSNFDAGGSAELMVGDKIINKTTESSPRAVANGWMVFSTAPDDDTSISTLAFDHTVIDIPLAGKFTPTILGYNKYDNLLNSNVTEFTLSCDENIGRCEGSTFFAGSKAASGMLTASMNGISVSKQISVGGGSASVKELATSPTGLISGPGCVGIGEEFIIKTAGRDVKLLSIYSSAGVKIKEFHKPGDMVSVTAPTVSGIYFAVIQCEDGMTACSKILVK